MIDFIDPQVDEAALFIHLGVYESVPAKLRGFAPRDPSPIPPPTGLRNTLPVPQKVTVHCALSADP